MVLTDKWCTTIASDDSGAVVIMNGRLDLEAFRLSGKLKHRIEIRLPYEADEKGMPTREAERIIAQVDDLLRPKMERDKLAILTGNHLPLEFDDELDPAWDEYLDMLSMNSDEGEDEGDEEGDLTEE